jgi:hypothetical protein
MARPPLAVAERGGERAGAPTRGGARLALLNPRAPPRSLGAAAARLAPLPNC